jgi:transposase
MARPTLHSPELEAEIVKAIQEGHYVEQAAKMSGISKRTFYNWKERGEAGEEPYASFLHAVEKAEAVAEGMLLDEIRTAQPATHAGNGGGGSGADLWQAKAWIMERRWPGRWSGRVRLTVDHELAALMKRLEAKLDTETFAKVVDASREDVAAEGASGASDSRH